MVGLAALIAYIVAIIRYGPLYVIEQWLHCYGFTGTREHQFWCLRRQALVE